MKLVNILVLCCYGENVFLHHGDCLCFHSNCLIIIDCTYFIHIVIIVNAAHVRRVVEVTEIRTSVLKS